MNRTDIPANPQLEARTQFEQAMLPTRLELLVGNPAAVEGRTYVAQRLKSYSVGIKGVLRQQGDTYFRVNADATLTDAARLVRNAQSWSRSIDYQRKALKPLCDEAGELSARLARQREAALEPPNHAGRAAIDAQLLAHYKTLGSAEAIATARNDPHLRAAIARAPAVLSGLSEDAHKKVRQDHWRHVEPDAAADLDDVWAAIRTANTALTALEKEGEKLIDFETAKAYEANQIEF